MADPVALAIERLELARTTDDPDEREDALLDVLDMLGAWHGNPKMRLVADAGEQDV